MGLQDICDPDMWLDGHIRVSDFVCDDGNARKIQLRQIQGCYGADMGQETIDDAIQTYYSHLFDEHARLTTRSAQGRLEFERTQEIVRALTPAPARVLDVGGATGVHSAALVTDGYEVVMIDPVPNHVATAAAHGTFQALVGDARDLHLPDDSFDAVLMAGPLYHLADPVDRHQALSEARRVCRPGGFVHAAAIPRFIAFAVAALHPEILDSNPDGWLNLLRHGTPTTDSRFPAGHFHTPEELHREMSAAGLHDVIVVGLEGPAGLALEIAEDTADGTFAAAKELAHAFQAAPSVRDFSCHLLGTGRV